MSHSEEKVPQECLEGADSCSCRGWACTGSWAAESRWRAATEEPAQNEVHSWSAGCSNAYWHPCADRTLLSPQILKTAKAKCSAFALDFDSALCLPLYKWCLSACLCTVYPQEPGKEWKKVTPGALVALRGNTILISWTTKFLLSRTPFTKLQKIQLWFNLPGASTSLTCSGPEFSYLLLISASPFQEVPMSSAKMCLG